MRTDAALILVSLVSLAASTTASAQEPRFSAAVKGGVTIEDSEDGLTGTVPAIGVTGSFPFGGRWRGEVEFWLPGYIEDSRGEPKHRDIVFGFSVVRTFGDGAARPFVLAGLAITKTQDWFTFCTADRVLEPGSRPARAMVSCDEPDIIERRRERNDGTDGYALVGGGVAIALTPRLGLVADVRVALAPVSVLVRPALGVSFSF